MLVRDVSRINRATDHPGCQPPGSASVLSRSCTRQRTKDDAHDRIRETDDHRAKRRMTPGCLRRHGGRNYFSNVHVAPAIPLLRPSDSSSILVKFSLPSVSCHLYLPGFASFEAIGPLSSVNSIWSFINLYV